MSDETLNPELLDSLGQPQEPAAEGTQNLPGSPTSVHYVFGEDNDHIEPELKARFEEILEALRDVIWVWSMGFTWTATLRCWT